MLSTCKLLTRAEEHCYQAICETMLPHISTTRPSSAEPMFPSYLEPCHEDTPDITTYIINNRDHETAPSQRANVLSNISRLNLPNGLSVSPTAYERLQQINHRHTETYLMSILRDEATRSSEISQRPRVVYLNRRIRKRRQRERER